MGVRINIFGYFSLLSHLFIYTAYGDTGNNKHGRSRKSFENGRKCSFLIWIIVYKFWRKKEIIMDKKILQHYEDDILQTAVSMTKVPYIKFSIGWGLG